MLLRWLAVGIMYVCNCSGIVAYAGLILVAKRVLCWAPKTVRPFSSSILFGIGRLEGFGMFHLSW